MVSVSDEGYTIEVTVTATNPSGSASATSSATSVIATSSGSCSGSDLCVSLPATSTAFVGHELGTQDGGYGYTATQEAAGGGSGTTIFQRLQALDSSVSRQPGYPSYNDASQTMISPINYIENGDSHSAWNFRTVDKVESMIPATAAHEYDVQWPDTLFACPSGSWSTGCTTGGPTSFADQSYASAATFFPELVRYFLSPMIESHSGSAVSYTANSVTDTSGVLAGTSGDCITATVSDSYGSPDWVTGTIASVSGNTATLSVNWSTSESYDTEDGNGALTATVPASGAAYNVASCTPPSGLTSPQDATPWPRPPSVGLVTNYEFGNEPQDENAGTIGAVPALSAPTPTVSGVNVTGGTLSAGSSYCYEVAAAGGAGLSGSTTPSSQVCITLPGGDNAVQISWHATSSDSLTPYAYVVYGRTSGGQLGLAAVGEDSSTFNASSFAWTDKGTVTPSGSPSASNNSSSGSPITPGVYVRLWNQIVPTMKSVAAGYGQTFKAMGPVDFNAATYPTQSVDPTCVTTNGLNSACANGDSSWSPDEYWEQALMTRANPLPDIITIHTYGTAYGDCSTPESANFSSVNSYELASWKNSGMEALDNSLHIPIWITENNYNAGTEPSGCFEQMLQTGSAWLAYNFIQWNSNVPETQGLDQWAVAGAATGEMFFEGYGLGVTSSNCTPQPACANLTQGEPGLNYWTQYEIDRLMGPGNVVNVSNVPAGYAAFAVQTDSTHVVLALVNIQQGADNGNGASGSVPIQVEGATVADTQNTVINGSTNMTTGPSTTDFGAESGFTANMAGYEVDLVQFTMGDG